MKMCFSCTLILPNQTHFHMKNFARRLVLKQRQMTTRKVSGAMIQNLGPFWGSLAGFFLVKHDLPQGLMFQKWRPVPI